MNPVIGAWVALSAVGLLVSLYLVRESWLDMRALGLRLRVAWPPWFWEFDEPNGRHLSATSRFWREMVRGSVHAPFLMLGLGALDSDARFTLAVAVLMWGNAAMLINSLIDALARRLLYQRRKGEPDLEH